MYVIIIYDIGQKRVNKVCKFLRKYLHWIQNSAFEGEISGSKLEKIRLSLKKMAKESDSILLFILENRHFIQKEIIGIEKSTPEQIL